MNIEPLLGLNCISFGTTLADVKDEFGEPHAIKNRDFEDGVSSEVWLYPNFGLELYFESENNKKLWGINITSEEISLEGAFPIGINEKELLSIYPSLTLSCEDSARKEFEYANKEIEFWLKDEIVYLIRVWSPI